jgi:hypothetical protein
MKADPAQQRALRGAAVARTGWRETDAFERH